LKGYAVDDELALTLLVCWEDETIVSATEELALEVLEAWELAADPGRAV
jgi:hypothetical protein